jgi:phage major head subunit gpT-like protein
MPRIPTATGLAGIKALWDSTVRPLVGADGAIAIADLAEILLLIPSTVSQELTAALSPAPGLKETIGDLVIKALAAGKLELVAKLYEAALGIPRDDFADDRIGLHNARIRDMAVKASWHPHQLLAETLEANPTAVDGTALFADSRADSIVGTFDNNLAPSMADAGGPTVVEFQTGMKVAISAMKGFTDAEGDRINVFPQFGLIVPPALEWQARACAEDQYLSVTTLVTNEVKGTFTPRVLPFLSSTVISYLYVKNSGAKPLVVQEREALTTESLGEGSDEWTIRKRALFVARARRVMAAGHPGLIAKMTWTHDS